MNQDENQFTATNSLPVKDLYSVVNELLDITKNFEAENDSSNIDGRINDSHMIADFIKKYNFTISNMLVLIMYLERSLNEDTTLYLMRCTSFAFSRIKIGVY